MELLQPKDFEVVDQNGTTRHYVISKFNAVDGREIVNQSLLSSIPKLGDYAVSQEIMFKVLSFVAVRHADGKMQRLITRDLIINHIPDWEALDAVEKAIMEYNNAFFLQEKVSAFLSGLSEKVPPLIMQILTPFLEQLSPITKPPSTNSEQSTL